MRLFVFAIGGTGSRVLSSLVMQLAAGAQPVDANGKPIEDCTVVPIIVDPHVENDGLQNVKTLLENYRTIHNSVYGETGCKKRGFFGTKIQSLYDINKTGSSTDTFFFRMNRVSDCSFEEFINKSEMKNRLKASELFSQLLFSHCEMDINMREGFYGSPNIGCVALQEFKESEDFKAFRDIYREGDKLLFIGSIFGGTGAAGLPLLITAIRDLAHRDNINGNGGKECAKASIGAIIVMPYFSIVSDKDSPINDNEFLIKTRTALRYYETNLNRYINNIYYISDPVKTSPFKNDPGDIDNQKGNKAHFVEFIGGLAAFDFLASKKNECNEVNGRVEVKDVDREFKAFSLKSEEKEISLSDFAVSTNKIVLRPFMEFYIFKDIMLNHWNDMGKRFTREFDKTVLTDELKSFFDSFDKWLEEMGSHGDGAHNLSLYSGKSGNYTDAFNGVVTKKRKWIGKCEVNTNDIKKKLNEVASEHRNDASDAQEYCFKIAAEAIHDVVSQYYDIDNL